MVKLWVLVMTSVAALAAGAFLHQLWRARVHKLRRRIPARWQLTPRPLLTDDEHEVWHWLRRAFFEHHVLVKVPAIRFMSPRSPAEGQQAHEALSGVYCSFTICAADGTVIGCIDIPGRRGLRASERNLKQKLFSECGLAYAVVRAGNLPTLEAVRAAFLGEIDLSDDKVSAANDSVLSRFLESTVEYDGTATMPGAMLTQQGELPAEPDAVDMLAVAEARNTLRAKLERNRKIHFTNFDPLSTGTGIVQDNGDQQFVVQWEDSFIDPQQPEGR
jgi:hypothetical protein